jgi:hypothetical protein
MLSNQDAKKLLLKTIYPQKITADFDIYIRYETKENPDKWKDQIWKRNNDKLEKAGLIKQVIIDTSLMFYVQSQARYESRHQYLYKAVFNEKLKSLIVSSNKHVKSFDEWDYYNRRTGRRDWLSCEVVCGEIKLDTILLVDQKKGPIEVYIDYKESFYPTVFNDLADYGRPKFRRNETYIRRILARKYPNEDWKLIY